MRTIFELKKKKSTNSNPDQKGIQPTTETTNQPQNNTIIKTGHMGLFTDICEYPDNIDFVNQEKDEKIVLFLRQHFATNFPWIASSTIALFIPPVLGFLINTLEIELFTVPSGLLVALIVFYYLVIFGYVYTSFLSWFFNIGIVTKKRIVDIDYSSILHKNIASVHLSEVVDTDFTQQGFFSGFYNYGNVFIQTESVKPNFEFTASPRPVHVTTIIQDLIAKKRRTNQ